MYELVTNFPKKQEQLYVKAMEQSGWVDVLNIEDTAYIPNTNKVLEGFRALYTISNEDHTPFWKVFDKLKQEMENKTNE